MILSNFLKHFKYVQIHLYERSIRNVAFNKVQLEEFRNAGNELRWQHEEDFTECQQCHVPFSMTWRKQHCRKCFIDDQLLIC